MEVSLPWRFLIRAQLQIWSFMFLCSDFFLKCGLSAKFCCLVIGLKFNFLGSSFGVQHQLYNLLHFTYKTTQNVLNSTFYIFSLPHSVIMKN